MKKLLLSLFFIANAFASSWNTATSFSAGFNTSKEASPVEWKIEQYLIHSSMPKVYYKLGFYKESLAKLSFSDGTILNNDTAENILLGVGYNIFTSGTFFIDAGASIGYRVNTQTTTMTSYDNAFATQMEYKSIYDSPFTAYADLGIGYALGKFTLRLDLTIAPQGNAQVTREDLWLMTAPPYLVSEDKTYSRTHLNLGVAYWW